MTRLASEKSKISRFHQIARSGGDLAIRTYLGIPSRLVNLLQTAGLTAVALQFLGGMYDRYPYDCLLGERLANLQYDEGEADYPLGSRERSEFLLKILARTYPSQRLCDAYFDNLHELLKNHEPLGNPGRLVLGLGTGRCGSTTLAGILSMVDGAISTHENPPLVFWEPLQRQVQFHLKRFRVMSRYFPLVFDCSHWWLNALDAVLDAFPHGRAIGLCRDTEACVRSFMEVTEKLNHWVPPYNHIWQHDRWDPTYPHYDVPENASIDRRRALRDLITRYVVDYNCKMKELEAKLPGRFVLFRTEDLDNQSTRQRLADYLEMPIGSSDFHLNVRSIESSVSPAYWY